GPARRRRREAAPLWGGARPHPLPGPLQAGIRSPPRLFPAAPSARLAARFPSRGGYGLTTLRRRNLAWVRPRLYAGGSSSAPEEFGAPGPGHVPFWSRPVSTFGLFFVTALTAVHLGWPYHTFLVPDRLGAGSRGSGSRLGRHPEG